MWPRPPAVAEDVRVGAPGVGQSVSKEGQAVEGTLFVDRADQLGGTPLPPTPPTFLRLQPGGVEGRGPEWVPEDIPQQAGLFGVFCISAGRSEGSCPGGVG